MKFGIVNMSYHKNINIFILLLAVILIFACNNSIFKKNNANKIIIENGEEFEIKLKSNPSTGYRWKIGEDSDTSNIRLLDIEEIREKTEFVKIGAPINEIWKFKAINKGNSTIVFYYLRDWENKPPVDSAIYRLKIK